MSDRPFSPQPIAPAGFFGQGPTMPPQFRIEAPAPGVQHQYQGFPLAPAGVRAPAQPLPYPVQMMPPQAVPFPFQPRPGTLLPHPVHAPQMLSPFGHPFPPQNNVMNVPPLIPLHPPQEVPGEIGFVPISYDPMNESTTSFTDIQYRKEKKKNGSNGEYQGSPCIQLTDPNLDFNRCSRMCLFAVNTNVCRHPGLPHEIDGTFCAYNILKCGSFGNINAAIDVPAVCSNTDIWDAWKNVLNISYLYKKVYRTPYILDATMCYSIFYDWVNNAKNVIFSIPHTRGTKINDVLVRLNFVRLSEADNHIMTHMNINHVVRAILNAGDGRVFLCGGAVHHILSHNESSKLPNDYDFFFVAPTVEEADDALYKCLKVLDDMIPPQAHNSREDDRYTVTKGVITARVSTDVIRHIKLQFIKRLYTSPSQILDGFDLPGCKYGYGSSGFFTTIDGAMAFLTQSFPIDTNQITTSHSYRITKYNHDKMFNILLPGKKIIEPSPDRFNGSLYDEFETMNGELMFTTKDGMTYNVSLQAECNISDYDSMKKHPLRRKIMSAVPDFTIQENFSYKSIGRLINAPHTLPIYCKRALDTMILDENVVENNINKHLPRDLLAGNRVSYSALKKILGGHLKRYLNADLNGNHEEMEAVRKEKWDDYRRAFRLVMQSMSEEHRWKTMNPGDQYFGKVNPLKVTPEKWYNDSDYIPTYVGITVERQIPLLLALGPTFPKDIFNLIMIYWAKEEIGFAYSSLV